MFLTNFMSKPVSGFTPNGYELLNTTSSESILLSVLNQNPKLKLLKEDYFD